jgi:hypothetical protein
MSEQPHPHGAGTGTSTGTDTGARGRTAGRQRLLSRTLLGTQWPGWLLLVLIALGLPRTVLADLGVVAPESSWIYYVLALTPFGVWLALAILRRTSSPMKDHLVAGTLYGLSLVVVHEALWAVGASQGQHPPQSAVTMAERFSSPVRELVLHGYTFLIAMAIGIGVGLIAGVVAVVTNRVRILLARRERSTTP